MIGQVYNSLDSAPGSTNASGPNLSPGWGLSVGGSEQIQLTAGGAVALYDSTGRVWLFTGDVPESCGSSFVSPAAIDATLKVMCSGTTKTGFDLEFNASLDTQFFKFTSGADTTAVLSTDTDADGNVVHYAYATSPATELQSITGTRGSSNVASFSYSSGSLTGIAQGTSPNIRSATLGYDSSGNLNSALDPAGNTTQFSYTSGLLTQLTEPNGNIITLPTIRETAS